MLKDHLPKATQLVVTFREISALHDVDDAFRVLAKGAGGAEVLVRMPDAFPRNALVDGSGEERHGAQALACVRWGVEHRDFRHFWRTFDRNASRTVDGKYVYVFQGTRTDGRDARLHRLIHFTEGRIAQLEAADVRAGIAQLPRMSHAGEAVLLTGHLFHGPNAPPTTYCYFFHLAPHPIPPSRIEALEGDVRWRAIRLGDFAYTDVCERADAASAIPALLADGENDKRSYLVHLPDALGEGLRRHEAYVRALDAFMEERKTRANDRRYTLAKRIQVATGRNPAFQQLVAAKLREYLSKEERRSSRLFLLRELAAHDVVRWIGPQRRAPGSIPNGRDEVRADVHHVSCEGVRVCKLVTPRQLEEVQIPGWRSTFSEAIRDYADAAPEVLDDVLKLAALVQHRLSETESGERWLEQNLGCAVSGSDRLAEAGADLIFQTRRKFVATVPEALGWFLEVYGTAWTRRHQEKALESLQAWIAAAYGVDLGDIRPRTERRAFVSRARRELKRARKRPPGSLDVKPAQVVGIDLADRAAHSLAFGIDLINVQYSLRKAAEKPRDPWSWVEATGSALDAYQSMTEVSARAPKLEVSLYRVGSKVARASPVAAVAGGIDVATGMKDTVDSELAGQAIGNGMKTTGAIMTVVYVLAPEMPALILLAAAGLAVQAIGSRIAGHFAPIPTFLRNCEFGEGGTLDSLVSRVAREKNDWMSGPLDALKTSLDAQHRALDQLLNRFEPELAVENGRLRLRVEMENPSQLSEASFFDIEVTTRISGEPARRRVLRAGEGFDDEPLLKGGWVDVTGDLDPPAIRPLGARSPEAVQVSGWVELDVYGDGKLKVRRELPEDRLALR